MPRHRTIGDLMDAELFREEEDELHDDEPMRNHKDNHKRARAEQKSPEPEKHDKMDVHKRFEELLSIVDQHGKKLQEYIDSESKRRKMTEEQREELRKKREEKRAQRLKEKDADWAKKRAEIEALVSSKSSASQRQTEAKYDEEIRKLKWAPFQY